MRLETEIICSLQPFVMEMAGIEPASEKFVLCTSTSLVSLFRSHRRIPG